MATKRLSDKTSLVNSFRMSMGAASAAIPNTPTIGVATAVNDSSATVAYTAAILGATASSFTATSTPGSLTGTGSSPITVSGLTASTSYTFTVRATNSNGSSSESSASNSITTLAPAGSFHSIATVTVGSGGTDYIEFTSIPSTYTHLQLRGTARDSRTPPSGVFNNLHLTLNSDTANNYSYHTLRGNGSTASSDGGGTYGVTDYAIVPSSTADSNTFGAVIYDILDYTNTNKYKTVKSLSGAVNNSTGTGFFDSASSVWQSLNAITTIKINTSSTVNFSQYTHFALYGIKGV